MKSSIKPKMKSFDYTLFTVVLILMGLGLLMVLSASSHLGMLEHNNPYHFFRKQAIFCVVGFGFIIVLSFLDYRIYKKFALPIFIVAIGLLVAVLLPQISSGDVRGATRWIQLPFFSLQPSEVGKLATIIFLSAVISKKPERVKSFVKGLIPYLLIVGIVIVLLFLEPHYSAIGIVVAVSACIIFVAGAKWSHIGILAGIVIFLGAIGIYVSDYRVDRIIGFTNPWADVQGKGWQVIQSLYALGSGGIFGLGLGQSKQKYSYLPDAHNDFILAILGEELGLIGMIVVVVLFVILIWRAAVIAMKAPDMFSGLVATGITMLIAIQVILNIAIVTSFFPVTGMPVPFMSYGGTSMIIFTSCIGILLNISRYSKKKR